LFLQFTQRLRGWEWKPILLCILAATVFWFFRSLNREHQANIEFPIKFYVPEGKYVTLVAPPSSISINVTGNGWNLLKKTLGLEIETIKVPISQPLYTKSISTSHIMPFAVEALKQLKVNFMMQDSIVFHYDTLLQKEVFLRLDTNHIAFEEGYQRISPVVLNPEKVYLKAPSEVINQLPDTLLISVNKTEISKNYDDFLPVNYPKYPFVTTDIEQVNVKFEVGFFTDLRLPFKVKLLNFEKGSYVYTENIVVTALTNINEYTELTDTATLIFDYKAINMNDSSITPVCKISERYSQVKIQPSKCKVRFQ
jgi:hypothetical protein